ncbi:MAG: D-alanyl-D-alanine carboxypeptidase/D-alanyl-D-alanine-endopeptidase [Balneolales bacterium]|nr:D-alanyl-D-alanine carboxypeptidase/D-alanyl-D-alanine-endopeptidase [Balneolales bacterium]
MSVTNFSNRNIWLSFRKGILTACLACSIQFGFPVNPVNAQEIQVPAADSLLAPEFSRVHSAILDLVYSNPASNAIWSVSLRDSLGNEVIDVDASKMMRLASNSKLFTSAGILAGLGPDFRFETRIYADGYLDEDRWVGDIHIIGAGDPSIDKHFYNDDPLYVFNSLISQIQEAGINSISGSVFNNESLFDDIRYPRGWEWDDLSFYYAPEISALSFNRNCVDLTVRATGRPGDLPEISWFPFNTDYVTFINEQTITPRNLRFNENYARILGTNTILLRSSLPQGYLEKESLTISDPALFFGDSFIKASGQRGLEILGEPILKQNRQNTDSMRLLAVHESEPVSALIQRINRNSDNFYTEMLTKALAAYNLSVQGSTEAGLGLVMEQLETFGIGSGMIRMRDASGMAGANLSSASAVTLLLHNMSESEYAEAYKESLALAGYHGTMQNRFLRSPAMGSVYAKSGFIAGVRTLSGYITSESGNRYTYSFLTNNFITRVAQVDQVHEQFINLIYTEL